MSKRVVNAAVAGVVILCGQSVVRADYLTVVDPIFSKTLVSTNDEATNVLAPNTWTTDGPLGQPFPGYFTKDGVIVWQNPAANGPNGYRRITGDTDGTHGLVPDYSVTWSDIAAVDPLRYPDGWQLPYEGCASLSATGGNEFMQILDARFKADKVYTMTVALGHNFDGGNPAISPAADIAFRIELFYLDTNNARQAVGYKDIFNDTITGLSANRMIDISTELITPTVNAIDQKIGVLMTTINPRTGVASGYFNVTNVRVQETPEPASLGLMLAGAALLLRRRRI